MYDDATVKRMALGMMAGDKADIEVIRTIQAQTRRCWKRYAQAFTGLDAADVAEVTQEARS